MACYKFYIVLYCIVLYRCRSVCVCCSEGCVCAFNINTGVCMPHYQPSHTSVVHSVDFTQSVVVSGSRDATVKVSQGH